ncbi:sensor histidine kinase KdpD [Martelella alba]|uniref:histidine kinase n=1 Tax=Martelella alba TaxID=2590451 RepID=A0A506TYQ0_9HYPH|nr:sensor histidine kinase KdpD [Martelella alba]TPW27202.1 sensor histidine kinase KdpD [Martelella alba]
MVDARRPSPEALLNIARREGRGRLKIFLGAAPGVGKTYAMLDAAARLAASDLRVVVGLVETHGRTETEMMLRDLHVLPRRPFFHNGRILHELDVDGVIAYAPDLALIDELAHSNLSGSRHEKRWQDVEDILDAGIDVYTTLNVQHVETLNDMVARITGVRVRETVPDKVLSEADEIALIDLPPDELIARLRAGKVYIEDQAARAVANFFAKGNLTALRELALRTAADRIDRQLQDHMASHAIDGPWPAQERILVVLPEDMAGRDAVRAGKRSADRARAEWLAIGVSSLDGPHRHGAGANALRLAEQLGARVSLLEVDQDPAAEVIALARRENVRRILLPRPPEKRPFWHRFQPTMHERLYQGLLNEADAFELTLMSEGDETVQHASGVKPPGEPLSVFRPGIVLATVVTTTGLAAGLQPFFPTGSLSLLFMTATVAIAARMGRKPAILAAGLSFLCFNFFFTDPLYTFRIFDRTQLLTLVLLLVSSILTGNLAARLRERVIAQKAAAERTAKLYDFSRQATAAASFDEVIEVAVHHVSTVIGGEAMVLVPPENGRTGPLDIAGAEPMRPTLAARELTAARFAFDHSEAAGRGSATLPATDWLFLPLRASGKSIGVLGIRNNVGETIATEERKLADALADQVALALERIRLSDDLAQSRLTSETERLRTALLSSVSHDLRTPLVSILGAAESLENQILTDNLRAILITTIRDEGERLDRYIQNLLDMTRLGHGALKPRTSPSDLRELVGAARQRLRGPLRDHPLKIDIPDDFPPVDVDPILMEQVFVNILDNAAKYSGVGAPIEVAAQLTDGMIEVAIQDKGAGFPAGEENRVFDMFWRATQGDGKPAGAGLGLAICRGIVEAHGGTISASAVPQGGACISFRLPIARTGIPE